MRLSHPLPTGPTQLKNYPFVIKQLHVSCSLFHRKVEVYKKLLVDVDARTALRLEDGEYKCFQATIDANSLPGSLSYPEGEGGGGGWAGEDPRNEDAVDDSRKGSCLNEKNHSLWLRPNICGLK